ncbi:MAG: hypothetical protein AB7I18_06700 [Candidatus Berkiella sp.]
MLQQQTRFSMDDLRGYRRTMDSLEELWIRKDYRLSEPTLEEKLSKKPKTQQKRKEELLAKACQELGIAAIIFEFKSLDLVNNKAAIKAQGEQVLVEKKNLLDYQMASLIQREIVRLLKKEAAEIFAFEEKMKEYRTLIAAILAQEKNEARFRTQGVPLEQKMQLEANLFNMRKLIHAESMDQLKAIFKQVDKLAAQYTQIQHTRQQNQVQHQQKMTNTINNFQVQGQQVFTPQQNTQLVNLYTEKNQIKNDIEILDNEIVKKKTFVQKAKSKLASMFKEEEKIKQEIKEEASHANAEQQQAAAEFISALEESSESEMEEFICNEELEHLQHDLDDLTSSSMNEVDPEKKARIRQKIDDISIRELRLQEKIAALKNKQEANEKKIEDKLKRLTASSWNPAALPMRAEKLRQLKKEQQQIQAKIEQAETEITELTAKRQVLSEKLHIVVDSIESVCDKAKDLVHRIFTSKKKLTGESLDALKENVSPASLAAPTGSAATAAAALAAVDELKASLDSESESFRQNDNLLAAQAAECAAQMNDLVAQAGAVAAVGAGCSAQLGAIAGNSVHNDAISEMDRKESKLYEDIRARAAVAMGATAAAEPSRNVSLGRE